MKFEWRSRCARLAFEIVSPIEAADSAAWPLLLLLPACKPRSNTAAAVVSSSDIMEVHPPSAPGQDRRPTVNISHSEATPSTGGPEMANAVDIPVQGQRNRPGQVKHTTGSDHFSNRCAPYRSLSHLPLKSCLVRPITSTNSSLHHHRLCRRPLIFTQRTNLGTVR
jgi:hypothetical protein